jgi:hypothetical protein
VEALRPYRKHWQRALDQMGKGRKAELETFRQSMEEQ